MGTDDFRLPPTPAMYQALCVLFFPVFLEGSEIEDVWSWNPDWMLMQRCSVSLVPLGLFFSFLLIWWLMTLKHELKMKLGRVTELRAAMQGKWWTFLFPMHFCGPGKILPLRLLFPWIVSSCSKASLISAGLLPHLNSSPQACFCSATYDALMADRT